MKPHPDKARMDELLPAIREYQKLASRHGIGDIFQDNGGKLLQVVLTLGLTVLGRRAGNDARDDAGREYELKSVNLDLINQFSTHHHLNPVILAKYRKVGWIFSFYRGIELVAVFTMEPDRLESLFARWEQSWHSGGGKDLNNRKVPGSFVLKHGQLIHGVVPDLRKSARPKGAPNILDPFAPDDEQPR